ncbi:hypothetical protein CAMRE0001_2254 [Campylobacter rectus RM3267]|uniref:Uncharacterized protein n=1 Tax=Campylobacter rectus RM3267 TaxID=553218 RepID=B9D394_CAMRE|nr:hypothetical protein CAMRE0001_2254 [Campylobacter rectus RM3267]
MQIPQKPSPNLAVFLCKSPQTLQKTTPEFTKIYGKFYFFIFEYIPPKKSF